MLYVIKILSFPVDGLALWPHWGGGVWGWGCLVRGGWGVVVGVERGQIHRGAFSRWVPFLRWYFFIFYFLFFAGIGEGGKFI